MYFHDIDCRYIKQRSQHFDGVCIDLYINRSELLVKWGLLKTRGNKSWCAGGSYKMNMIQFYKLYLMKKVTPLLEKWYKGVSESLSKEKQSELIGRKADFAIMAEITL